MKPITSAMVAVVLLVGVGLGVAAAADRSASPAPATTEATEVAGFGEGPVPRATPHTDAWAAIADLSPAFAASSDNACERGDPACLDVVIEEMEARLTFMGDCDGRAVFAFTYLEMTRGVRDAVREPDFFDFPPGTSHFDALFAGLYFDAFDNWEAGRTPDGRVDDGTHLGDVPGVWRIAFAAAESGETDAATNLLLGMNAHIARDLPYVVARSIDADPSLVDDPTDYLRINEVIAGVKDPMLAAAAERFDPALADLSAPLRAVAGTGRVDLIGLWRDQAFERGVALAHADTPQERRAVAEEIDREAAATAVLMLNAGSADTPPSLRAASEDSCVDAPHPPARP